MKTHFIKSILVLLVLLFSGQVSSQNISQKAVDFLNLLSTELRGKAQFPLEDNERYNFNFVPIERKGPTFHDFNEKQKNSALALLRACLSEQGFQKATDIMELEKVLIIIEKQATESNYRDPLNYHFLIFGNPSADRPWGWRFEGHHVSISFFTNKGELVSSTPSFFGSNPGTVTIEEQKGKQVLRQETELGFALVNSLSSDQLGIARFSEEAPKEIITGTKRKVDHIDPRGIYYSALNENQKKLFNQLLEVYVKNYQLGFSKRLMDKIQKAGLEKLSFAWAGGLKPGVAQYYRIQGPTLLIEYDNIQNNANHVHTIVRDLTNDFAEDILRAHYEKEHK